MTGTKKRFSGIGSISSNEVPAVASPSPSISPAVPSGNRPEPMYADLFRAALARVSSVYLKKPALVSFMGRFNGGFYDAAARSGDKFIQEQAEISKNLRGRANKQSAAGADQSAIEDAIALWEAAELRLLDLLDKATVHSQLRLI